MADFSSLLPTGRSAGAASWRWLGYRRVADGECCTWPAASGAGQRQRRASECFRQPSKRAAIAAYVFSIGSGLKDSPRMRVSPE